MHVQGVNSGPASAGACGASGAQRTGAAASAASSAAGQQVPAGAARPAHSAYPQPHGSATGGLSSGSLAAALAGQETRAGGGVSQGNGAAPSRQALELAMAQAAQSYLPPVQAQAGLGVTT